MRSLVQFQLGPPRPTGGVAQLGEHLLCKQGVIGSIPFTSTKNSAEVVNFLTIALLTARHGWAMFFDNRREDKGQDKKGVWWMPWHQGAKKDAAGCEKPRGFASES